MKRIALTLLVLSGCAAWRSVERVEWRRVYAADETRRTAEARQEIISRDKYEEEVAGGVRRAWEPLPGYLPPFLHEVGTIGLKVGEVMEFRVDEAEGVELQVGGDGVDVYWAPMVKVDEWKGDEGVTKRQSTLLVRGAKAGKATLRLSSGTTTKDVPAAVKER